MKSPDPPSTEQVWYVPTDDDERFVATAATAGPWGARAQHGGPPAALLGRAIERLAGPDRVVGRIAFDLLGPVPIGPLRVSATVVRPGRTVALLAAEMYDESAGRAVVRASAWVFPRDVAGPAQRAEHPTHGPDDGRVLPRPEGWGAGYLDTIDWRWVDGVLSEPGPGIAWMRPTVPLVAGEDLSGLQRLLACVDSASGVSAALDIREWDFLNTELTVSLLREPVGEWICLDARTTLGPGSVGIAAAAVYDAEGLVARSMQTLLVVPTRR